MPAPGVLGLQKKVCRSLKERIAIVIRGAVQGVGFRPFVYRLASEFSLPGWVSNSPAGVLIEAEGPKESLDAFLLRLQRDIPPRASIQSLEFSFLDPVNYQNFSIRPSDTTGTKTALVLPDIATCPDCLAEIFDPADRRHRYPFTNCTNCGPRYSIIHSLPYDRPNTTMRAFIMCERCRKEYEDPTDRRFHAQPNACPDCGPHLEAWLPGGERIAGRNDAITAAADSLRGGGIVALKGLGGFHLMTDARNPHAVRRLRSMKRREEKPFAVMFPSIAAVEEVCGISPFETRLLNSPEAPIVLLARRRERDTQNLVTPVVAPQNPTLGVMLPYTPLHHLLMRDLGFPVVATSGNLSDEPICTDENEAIVRIGEMADLFLVHNRPIRRHVDDSIVRIVLGREMILRRARGYAPLPIRLPAQMNDLLAVGSHLKNTVAVTREENVFISQHIGDLETTEAHGAFRGTISSLLELFDVHPVQVVSDLHPDYLSSRYARELSIPVLKIQHHFAHIAACMAENEIEPPVLGVAWDGTGYGPDGTVWGGEFLRVTRGGFTRAAALQQFSLPGGDAAVREPRRSALGVLFQTFGQEMFQRRDLEPLAAFSEPELDTLRRMLLHQINSPTTSSAGRLFDAVASLIGMRHHSAYEGQAAMELEFHAGRTDAIDPYPYSLRRSGTASGPPGLGTLESQSVPAWTVDWTDMIRAIVDDRVDNVPTETIAARFHRTLADTISAVAERVGIDRVALSGGCFQNRVLLGQSVRTLERKGVRVYWHQRVPPNDGGIALGQLNAARILGQQH